MSEPSKNPSTSCEDGKIHPKINILLWREGNLDDERKGGNRKNEEEKSGSSSTLRGGRKIEKKNGAYAILLCEVSIFSCECCGYLSFSETFS